MEIVSSDGSIAVEIEPGQTRELGRANVLDSSDKTISRRQISFFVPPLIKDQETTRAQFEILGRNPVYVSKGHEVKVFRRSEKGEMESGEMFCFSAKNPVWYTLREIGNGGQGVRRNDLESELAESLESDYGIKCVEDLQQDGVDVSNIDPVKEFGFLVIGHEFDSYPKKKIIHDIKHWDWFLEESKKHSDEDEDDDGKKGKLSKRSRKRKKGKDNDDEEWTGESDDEKVSINKSKSDRNPKYVTRSKDRGKRTRKDISMSKNIPGQQNREVDVEDQEDKVEDEDETLGGFIVDDENLEEEVEDEDEEEEEEEDELVDEDEDE